MPDPHPKPPRLVNLPSLARVHTEAAIRTLAKYASGRGGAPAAVQVAACAILLDRGWGRVAAAAADSDGDLRIVIRHIVDGIDRPSNGAVIEHMPGSE
jgi:hypothetical protein